MDARCIGCALNPGSKVGREALVALNIVDIICALNNDRCCYKKKKFKATWSYSVIYIASLPCMATRQLASDGGPRSDIYSFGLLSVDEIRSPAARYVWFVLHGHD